MWLWGIETTLDSLEVVTNMPVPGIVFHSFIRGPTHSFPHLGTKRLRAKQLAASPFQSNGLSGTAAL